MLDFWNYKVLTVQTMGRIISVELRYRAKFRGDWSNRCRDISILNFSTWWQPPSWFLKFYTFNDPNGQGRTASLCQILSKSLKQRRRYVSFRYFQDGGRHVVGQANVNTVQHLQPDRRSGASINDTVHMAQWSNWWKAGLMRYSFKSRCCHSFSHIFYVYSYPSSTTIKWIEHFLNW